jgi:hypothetical protein
MVQLLGWLRPPLPPRPSQEARDKGGKRRRQVAAPPAGSSASGAGGEPRVQQPPKSDGCPAEGEGTPSSLEQGGSKAVAALPGAMGVAAILSRQGPEFGGRLAAVPECVSTLRQRRRHPCPGLGTASLALFNIHAAV